jgi:tRNA (cmo5U34)-methyltransferase
MSASQRAPFDPQQYERLSTGTVPGYAALQELVALAAAAEAPSPRAAVLDLGCGTGAGLLALARALPDAHLTACDPAPAMVEAARTRCEDRGVKAQLVVGGLAAVAQDPPFDVIVCTLVLHFIRPPDRVPLLADLRARLRPGGRLVISALGRSTEPDVQAVWTKVRRHHAASNGIAPAELAARDVETQGKVFPIGPEELSTALRGAGFTSIAPLYRLLAVHSWLAGT